ncbi:MAG: beta/gamma crystallin-related protein [Casimicrobiaceae bacterium]
MRIHSAAVVFLLALLTAGAATGQITFYERPDFRGRTFTTYDAIRDFTRYGFNDKAASVVVRDGAWQVCTDAEFRGECVTLNPGRFPTLISMGIKNRVSSLRPLGGSAPPPGADRPSIVLFGRPGMRGRSVTIDQPIVRDFARLGFDERASSLRVDQGYWLLCSDPDFEGECRTFGPGEYAELPPMLADRVSSARRIGMRYPYRDRPRWRD